MLNPLGVKTGAPGINTRGSQGGGREAVRPYFLLRAVERHHLNHQIAGQGGGSIYHNLPG